MRMRVLNVTLQHKQRPGMMWNNQRSGLADDNSDSKITNVHGSSVEDGMRIRYSSRTDADEQLILDP